MATHSSVLAWRIPGTGEPGGLPSMGSHRVGHDWSYIAVAADKVLELQLQHHSFQWIFRVDFLKIDCFDLLAIQRILKRLLQHHNSKAPILWHSTFFMVQHPYMTTGKTIVLTIRTFVSKGMSLLFNMLSRFAIASPWSSKCLLLSWLQSL